MSRENDIQKLAEIFIKTKSEKDFNNLFKRLKPGVLNHCYLILKDPDLTEDAFLNTMVKIWTKIDQYDIVKANFSTWCYNIARNESLFIIKINNKTSVLSESNMESLSYVKENNETFYDKMTIIENPIDDIFDEDPEKKMHDIILEEIFNLPEMYKDVMIDREINHMKYKDIAAKYNIKKRSISTKIRRARARIRKNVNIKMDLFDKI